MGGPPNARKGRTALFLFTSAAITIIGCCGGLVAFWDWPSNGIRVEQLEAELNDQLPDGSTWEQAEAWFASRGIKTYEIGEGAPWRASGFSATIPNGNLLISADIEIELYFTPDRRLRHRVIERTIYTLGG